MYADRALSSRMTGAVCQRRNKLISFRISQELYDLVHAASIQVAGGSVSDFAREAIEDAILQRPAAAERVVVQHLSTLCELVGELDQSVKSLRNMMKVAEKRGPHQQSGHEPLSRGR